MACPDVKLACCRLCGKPLASDLGACIHCGVCNPIAKETCSWLHRVLLILLILGTVLATLRYETKSRINQDCSIEAIGPGQGC